MNTLKRKPKKALEMTDHTSCRYQDPTVSSFLTPVKRAEIYQELARLYRSPSWEQVTGTFHQILLKYPRFLLDNRDTHFHIAKELDRLEKESYRFGLEAFQEEYVRLFVNSPQGVLAPPYASFYTEETMFGQAAQAALAYYRQYHLAPEAPENEPPDHIVYELDFLSLLCSMEQEALDGDKTHEAEELRKAQADFLCDHLFPWVYRFFDRIVQHSCLAYYQLLAAFMKGFFVHERMLLESKTSRTSE